MKLVPVVMLLLSASGSVFDGCSEADDSKGSEVAVKCQMDPPWGCAAMPCTGVAGVPVFTANCDDGEGPQMEAFRATIVSLGSGTTTTVGAGSEQTDFCADKDRNYRFTPCDVGIGPVGVDPDATCEQPNQSGCDW